MSTEKLSPENIQIPTTQKATASSLMGFSSDLKEFPSRLPDGTILDYSAVDETWKDVDFPERTIKTEEVASPVDTRKALEESFFRDFKESKLSHVNPPHLVKHITRVQAMTALVPVKTEAIAVVRFDKTADGAVAQGNKRTLEMKKWLYKKDPTEMGERSPEARANKQRRRDVELGVKVSQNKKAAAGLGTDPHALSATLAKPADKKTWSKKPVAGAKVHAQPGYFSWRAKQKQAAPPA